MEGCIASDPRLRAAPNGAKVCTFSIASTRFYKGDDGMKKEVSFFNVESGSKLAENCYNVGRKGGGVRVVGRLKQDRWDGEDGKFHSKVIIVAEHVEFRREAGEEGASDCGGGCGNADIAGE
jgi:single-strand DNA-binding protein